MGSCALLLGCPDAHMGSSCGNARCLLCKPGPIATLASTFPFPAPHALCQAHPLISPPALNLPPFLPLVLPGGHDHEYSAERSHPHGIPLVKSGTDFRDLTAIKLALRPLQQQQQQQQPEHAATEEEKKCSSGAAEQDEVQRRRAAAVKLVAASRQMGSMVLRRRTFTTHLKLAARMLGSMGRQVGGASGLGI